MHKYSEFGLITCNVKIYRTACQVTRQKSHHATADSSFIPVASARREFDVPSKGTESGVTCSCDDASKNSM